MSPSTSPTTWSSRPAAKAAAPTAWTPIGRRFMLALALIHTINGPDPFWFHLGILAAHSWCAAAVDDRRVDGWDRRSRWRSAVLLLCLPPGDRRGLSVAVGDFRTAGGGRPARRNADPRPPLPPGEWRCPCVGGRSHGGTDLPRRPDVEGSGADCVAGVHGISDSGARSPRTFRAAHVGGRRAFLLPAVGRSQRLPGNRDRCDPTTQGDPDLSGPGARRIRGHADDEPGGYPPPFVGVPGTRVGTQPAGGRRLSGPSSASPG